MTRAGEKLYRIWEPRPPGEERPVWMWIAVAAVMGMLVVSAWRGDF